MVRALKHSLVLPVGMFLIISSPVAGDSTREPPDRATVQGFLRRHWQRPIPPQGRPPAAFSALEASLDPQSCGTCHPAQLADWTTSLHARSMGPGMTGQLAEMWRTDAESARLCLTCHAPLAEQQPENRAIFDGALHRQGLVCAACHVREHERFGPPRRPGDPRPDQPREKLPHRGATRTPAFAASEFCASCHQFEADGFALNGKLLENTYAEWKASPAARRGRQCQDCHMPERKHVWRGIHDPETVRAGLVITLATDRSKYRPGDAVTARLTITSTGVGHHFPTYVTPRVVVRTALVDAAGREAPASAEERVIAREVTLDLSRELFDTRIPAGGRFSMAYQRRLERAGLRLRVVVTVYPDHFYTRFFGSLLTTGAGRGDRDIREALEATRRSAFELYRREIPLT
ncbi:MAG: multiheme c-type cytochrome [Candidatus Rokuibacteriota bacterium]